MLQVENMVVGYVKDIDILQGVTVHVEPGSITAVIGANGVGKSTLLKTVAGFLPPRRGHIDFEGTDITRVSSQERLRLGLAYVPQGRGSFPYMTVQENLEIGCWTFRSNKNLVTERISQAYDRFPELVGRSRQKAGDLSGGLQRLLEMARALLTEPSLLLVDEPTAGLAPIIAAEVYRELAALNRAEGKAVLLVDQNIRAAVELADYIYVLELGKNKLEGSREKLAAEYGDLVAQWLF